MKLSTDKTFFTLKSMSNMFFPHTFCAVKLDYVVVPSIVVEILFRDILRIVCHVDFKYGSATLVFQQAEEATNKILAHGHCPFTNSQAIIFFL